LLDYAGLWLDKAIIKPLKFKAPQKKNGKAKEQQKASIKLWFSCLHLNRSKDGWWMRNIL
jgi:hypothetical protein